MIKFKFFTFIFILFFCATVFAQETTSEDRINFLSLADIHFDPFVACHNEKPCPLIQKLRQAPVSEWAKIFTDFERLSSAYRQDTNYLLLKSALNAAKVEAERSHIKFVIVLGDFLGHEYRPYYIKFTKDKSRSGYRAFVKKTMQFLMSELAKTFPNINVYSVIGNNDSYGGDYAIESHGQFLQDAVGWFSSVVQSNSNRVAIANTLPIAGYYAIDIPDSPQMRLIVLDSVLFSPRARGKGVEHAAVQQLNWLYKELQSVKAKNQKALIALHIPSGIDVYATLKIKLFTLVELWNVKYTRSFQSILREFAPQVSAIFAGHLHADWFQIHTYNGAEIPVTGTPSISPIFGNNPGFKIYSYSTKTLELGNFVTYYYPITSKQAWGIEYDFNRTFSSSCHDCPVTSGMNSVQANGENAEQYKKFYAVSTKSQPITTKFYPYYWCAIRDVEAKDYSMCVGHDN